MSYTSKKGTRYKLIQDFNKRVRWKFAPANLLAKTYYFPLLTSFLIIIFPFFP